MNPCLESVQILFNMDNLTELEINILDYTNINGLICNLKPNSLPNICTLKICSGLHDCLVAFANACQHIKTFHYQRNDTFKTNDPQVNTFSILSLREFVLRCHRLEIIKLWTDYKFPDVNEVFEDAWNLLPNLKHLEIGDCLLSENFRKRLMSNSSSLQSIIIQDIICVKYPISIVEVSSFIENRGFDSSFLQNREFERHHRKRKINFIEIH